MIIDKKNTAPSPTPADRQTVLTHRDMAAMTGRQGCRGSMKHAGTRSCQQLGRFCFDSKQSVLRLKAACTSTRSRTYFESK